MKVFLLIPLLTLFGLQVKHLLCDFFWQTPYEVANKGIYMHPGGQVHSFKHAVGTAIVFFFLGAFLKLEPQDVMQMMMETFLIDWTLHYHIDWAKNNITQVLQKTTQDAGFWYLLGFDQFLHQLTYLALVYYFT